MKRFILPLILVIFVAGIISVIYLSKTVLPTRIKIELVKTLEERLERKIELGEIQFNPFKGFLITDLIIYDNPKYGETPLLNIKEASINLSWLSMIIRRQFIVTSININQAEFKIIRLNKNLWNFSDFLNRQSKKDGEKLSFIVYRIGISDSKVQFQDRTFSPALSETVEDLNLRANVSLALNIKFNLDAKLRNGDYDAFIQSKGRYNTNKKKFSTDVKIKNIFLNRYYPYFKIPILELKEGLLQNLDLKLTLENKKIDSSAKAQISNLNLQKDNLEFLGSLSVDTDLVFDPAGKDKFIISGHVKLIDDHFKGIPLLHSIKDVNGAIVFDKNKIQTQGLTAITSECPIRISGSLENFRNPSIDINISSDIKFANITYIIPDKFKSHFSYLDGDAKLNLNTKGKLRKIKNLDFSGEVKISGTSLKLNSLPEKISDINTDVNFNKDTIKWQNFSCKYNNIDIASQGTMNGFGTPIIESDIKSAFLNLSTKVSINKNKIDISKLKGTYYDSTFDISGNLDTAEEGNPLFNLSIDSMVDLKELNAILPKFKERLDKIKAKGLLALKGNLKGKFKDWQGWQVNLKGGSEQIQLYGLKFDDAKLQLVQTQNIIKNFSFKSSPYEGALTIDGSVNLSENFPYLFDINITNIDLSKLKMDTPLKQKPISGFFFSELQISGHQKAQDSMTGAGMFKMQDGNLWQLSLLRGLGEFLFIPEFDKITFKEASGNFIIEKQAAHTDNLKFLSDELNLACEGWIDFNGNLDFAVATQFSERILNESKDLRRVITSAIEEVNQIISVRLTGNLKKPKYSIVFKPVKYFKEILEGIGLDIF